MIDGCAPSRLPRFSFLAQVSLSRLRFFCMTGGVGSALGVSPVCDETRAALLAAVHFIEDSFCREVEAVTFSGMSAAFEMFSLAMERDGYGPSLEECMQDSKGVHCTVAFIADEFTRRFACYLERHRVSFQSVVLIIQLLGLPGDTGNGDASFWSSTSVAAARPSFLLRQFVALPWGRARRQLSMTKSNFWLLPLSPAALVTQGIASVVLRARPPHAADHVQRVRATVLFLLLLIFLLV